MKITLEQLKTLIREAVEDAHGKTYSAAELLKALEDAPDEAFDDEPKEEGEEEDVEDYHDPRPGDFARRRLEEGKLRLVYTNHGILTEERVRELKESGYEMEECGSWDAEGPAMMDEPKVIVIRSGLEEEAEQDDKYGDRGHYSPGYGSMEEDVLEEGDTSSPADGGSVTGTQVAVGMPSGPGGAPAPSGAAVTSEGFNRRAEALLEAWMEEETEEEELHGDQEELDVAAPFGKLTGADFKALGQKAAHEKHRED